MIETDFSSSNSNNGIANSLTSIKTAIGVVTQFLFANYKINISISNSTNSKIDVSLCAKNDFNVNPSATSRFSVNQFASNVANQFASNVANLFVCNVVNLCANTNSNTRTSDLTLAEVVQQATKRRVLLKKTSQ